MATQWGFCMQDIKSLFEAGRRLAGGNHGTSTPSHEEIVWELLLEAFATLKTLPDPERRFLRSGTRSHHVPTVETDVARAAWEATLNSLFW